MKTPIKICHVIDSLTLGGAQIMMLELVSNMDKPIQQSVISLGIPNNKYRSLYDSYKVKPMSFSRRDFISFFRRNKCDIVIQHRTGESHCLKHLLPPTVKYILINHTFSNLDKMKNFRYCDCYISVCNFLHENTPWHHEISPIRKIIILNGVKIDASPQLNTSPFISGRCHRLVPDKFDIESLKWFDTKVKPILPNHQHYLVGKHKLAEQYCKTSLSCKAFGEIKRNNLKRDVLRQMSVYFYETFAHEGASIAILEALACGVPVLCKNYGGNSELVTNEVNGFIVKDRDEMLSRLVELSDPARLKVIHEQTKDDFSKRLDISIVIKKYVELFNSLL